MSLEVIDFELSNLGLRAQYDELFEECPTAFIQQSTYWADVIKDLGPDKPIFLICKEDNGYVGGLPLYLYGNARGNLLTSVPQPGPMGGVFHRDDLSEAMIDAVYHSLLSKAVEIARRYDCIAMTIITNPFKPDIERYQAYVKPDFVFENFTQYICLNEPARRSHGHRNRLNKAKKHNFRVTVEDGLRALRSWYEIHKRRHQEIGASPLDYQLFENIVVNLSPRNKARIILVWLGDDIISGGLYVRHKNIVDVFMISMNSDYATLGPSFINTDYSLQWARQLGTTTYNWQSSQNKSCGVYEYKKQWGSKDSSYCFVTKLFCSPSIIEELGPTGIKKDYPWHFVVPFDCFTKGFGKTYFTKT